MNCKLCKREIEGKSGLCRYHLAARDALKSGYQRWKEAYSEMSWEDYLKRIKEHEETGQWIKEVAELKETDRVD